MIAENRTEFFAELERELQRLGIEDSSDLIADLGEHFAEGERRGLSESEVCRELGSISEIARSCLDLKSSAINSMVARDVSRKKAVSLTKPGRDVPADPALAKTDAEDSVRSVTPEHIAQESVPNVTLDKGSQDLNVGASGSQGGESSQSGNVGAGGSQGGESSQSGNAGADGSQGSESSQDTNAGVGGSQSGNTGGTFERIGKKVDAACDKAGRALNEAFGKAESALDKAGSKVNGALKKSAFSPSDSYRKNFSNSKRGEMPKQSAKVKTQGGGEFVDVSTLQPNVKPGRLVGEIILDVLLWIWLVPTVIVGVIALFAASAGCLWFGVRSLFGWGNEFARFFLPTRILFTLGFAALASAVFCLAMAVAKPAFSLPAYVLKRHYRAVYDI